MKDGGKVALGIAGGSLALLVLWGLTKLIKPAPPAPPAPPEELAGHIIAWMYRENTDWQELPDGAEFAPGKLTVGVSWRNDADIAWVGRVDLTVNGQELTGDEMSVEPGGLGLSTFDIDLVEGVYTLSATLYGLGE